MAIPFVSKVLLTV